MAQQQKELPAGTVTFLSSRLAGGAPTPAQREQHEQAVAAALDEHGGVEVERGDGSVLGVFSSPGAAVAAAIDLINGSTRGSGMRVALHTGEVDGYPGPAGDHAALVGGAAAEGQVLLTATTAALVAHGLEPGGRLETLGSRVLPGLDRPETLFELRLGISSTPVHARERPFLERDGELAAILALAERAERGDGSLVVIEGSAGIGKTRLLTEARQGARRRHARARRARRRVRGRVRVRRRAAAVRGAARDRGAGRARRAALGRGSARRAALRLAAR